MPQHILLLYIKKSDSIHRLRWHQWSLLVEVPNPSIHNTFYDFRLLNTGLWSIFQRHYHYQLREPFFNISFSLEYLEYLNFYEVSPWGKLSGVTLMGKRGRGVGKSAARSSSLVMSGNMFPIFSILAHSPDKKPMRSVVPEPSCPLFMGKMGWERGQLGRRVGHAANQSWPQT